MRRRFFGALLFFGVLAIFLSPYAAFAAGPLDGALVPACNEQSRYEGGFAGACQLCDLRKLANNVLNFAVALTAVIAALMFAYAGFLYFTAAVKEENIKKAHEIFMRVFAGMVIVLIAWLVVNIFFSVLTGQGLSFWGEITCERYPQGIPLEDRPPPSTAEGSTGSRERGGTGRCSGTAGVPYDADDELRVRQALNAVNTASEPGTITTNYGLLTSSGELVSGVCDQPGETTGCTNVGGFTEATVNYILELARYYPSCTMTITGGSEGGHCEHNNGTAFDLRLGEGGCPALDTNVRALPNGVSGRGAYWLEETSPAHWHVCVPGRGQCD